MGGQSSMGGASSQIQQPMQGGQPMSGGFDLSKLFMGNMASSGGSGAPAAPLPQIQAPARPPMPVMPQRAPMPVAQAPASGGYWDNLISQGSMRDRIEADPQGFARYWKHQRGQAAQMSPVERSRMRGGR